MTLLIFCGIKILIYSNLITYYSKYIWNLTKINFVLNYEELIGMFSFFKLKINFLARRHLL